MMHRTGRFRLVLTAWLEEQIEKLVDLPAECIQQAGSPDVLRQERLSRFRHAAFVFMSKNISVVLSVIVIGLFIQCCAAKAVLV